MDFFLKKHVVQHWYPNQLYGSPINIMYTMIIIPKYTDSVKHDFTTILPSGFKNRYANVNKNL